MWLWGLVIAVSAAIIMGLHCFLTIRIWFRVRAPLTWAGLLATAVGTSVFWFITAMVFYYVIGFGPEDFNVIRQNALTPTFGLLLYPCDRIPFIEAFLGSWACEIPYWILAPSVFGVIGLLCIGVAVRMRRRTKLMMLKSLI